MGTVAAGRRTLVLVNLAAILERADEALLPAVYKEVGAALHVSPAGLGSLTLFRSIVQSSCYPLAAYMAARHNRTHVIALGAFLWATATFLVALSNTYLQVAISRAFNGVGLALVIPAIQSLVADSTDDSVRGSAFGWLQLTGNIGSILGGCFSLLLASTTFMGIAGWRVAFHVVGIISVVVGLLIRIFALDPHFSDDVKPADVFLTRKSVREEVKYMLEEAKAVIKIPSFRIIVAQGVAGSFPWSALLFAPMWLELIGYSHNQTGVLMSSAIPLAALLMLFLPDDPSAELGHALLMFVTGLSISLSGPATNSPISAEIVPEKSRTSIYALDRSFVSVLSSFAPPIVGILAEHVYGYKPIFYGPSESTSVEIDRQNASSLAKALYTAIAIPMLLCCFIYSFLYCTYPRDRERARMNLLKASEMQQMELDDDHEMFGESSGLRFSEMGLGGEERSVIDIVCGGEDFETDDNDERALLSHKVD
ncbi:Major Facilitator Superfamily [Musa troglodytarum]|uniref:Major Facilitator Superfamily n=1 Tax=Musa troglodytarum TaxID=320322 RepID=A0A9E7LC14_9LILI|nr:Major Facilitator Superfamily [Musa troglodytarum]